MSAAEPNAGGDPAARPASRWPALAVGAALVLAVLGVYAEVGTFELVSLDDPLYVSENPQVKAGLTAAGVRWAFTAFHASNWHPLTWLSHMLDVQLFGLDAGAHHQVNVALHALATVLLFAFLRLATGALWRSALVAALFAVHPLHVESVAWVSERKDVLSTALGFGALVAYVAHVRRPSAGRYAAVAALLALGLLAKPMLVSIPLVLLLLDVWPLARWTPGRSTLREAWPLVREKLPLAALAAASVAVTIAAQARGGTVAELDTLPVGARLGNAVLSCAAYLRDTVWPAGLAAYYPHPALGAAGLSAVQVTLAAVLLIALTSFAAAQAKRWPHLAVGWAWYLVTLLPVIGVVQVGAQARADRYTYVPLVGVFMAVAWSLPLWRSSSVARRVAAAGVAAVLVVAAMAARAQTRHWRDTVALHEHAIAVTGDNALAWGNLGVHHLSRGRVEEAIGALRQAVTIAPRSASHWLDLGAAYRASGKLADARDAFARAAELAPGNRDAAFQLGMTHLIAGDPRGAIGELERAVGLDARHPGAWAALAVACALIGDEPRSRAAAQRVRELAPELAHEVDWQLANIRPMP